ncbi:MAG: hypothetical protein HY982_00430 [Candidatus Magasanikbacteria bacterium]|nr:hypothetical protein [Candidatus Magasanikbacteria bacterium]
MPQTNQEKPLEGEVVEGKDAEEKSREKNLLPLNLDAKNKSNFFIGTLNLAAAPVKALSQPLRRHYRRRYHGQYKHAKKLFALDIFLILLSASLLTASLYFFFNHPAKNFLTISLTNQKPPAVGATENFDFLLNNNSDKNLSDLAVRLEFPKNFVLKEPAPNFDLQSSSLRLGFLKAKDSVSFSFRGTAWGAVKEKQKISARATFLSAANEQREEIFLLELPLQESALAVSWEAPPKIKVGQNFSFSISYQNNSSEKIAQAVLVPALPADFSLIASNQDLKDGRFFLKEIPAGQKGTVKLTGFVKSLPRVAGFITLSLQSFLEHEKIQYLQASLLKTLEILPNGLDLKFKVEDGRSFFKPGEEVALKITAANSSAETIKDLRLTLPLPLEITENKTGMVALSKKDNPALAEIAPGENREISLRFKIVAALAPGKNLNKNFSLELRPQASFYASSAPEDILRSFTAPQEFKISTFLKLHAEARYFTEEGDQLGRGPLPPETGKTTKYWISWFVTSFPNAVKDLTIRGRLAEGVSWTGKTNVVEGEAIKYDSLSRVVSWKNSRVEATEGDSCPCLGIGFEVALTPTEAETGKIINLMENLAASATDIYTDEYVESAASNLTTDLVADSFAQGKNRAR